MRTTEQRRWAAEQRRWAAEERPEADGVRPSAGAPPAAAPLEDVWRRLTETQVDLPRLLDRTARNLAASCHGGCSIRILSGDGARLIPVAVHHADARVLASLLRTLGAPEEISEGCWGPLVRERTTVRVLGRHGSSSPSLSPLQRELAERHGVSALLGLPLVARGTLIGALVLARHDGEAFDDDDEEAFRDAAERITLAIDNALLFDDLQREQRRAAQVLATLEALVASAPIGLALLDRDLTFVHINDQLARMNAMPAAWHVGRAMREVIPALGEVVEPLARGVLETGIPLLDVALSFELPHAPGDLRHYRASYYPVSIGGGPGVGALVVDVTDQVRAAERVALERARLFEAETRARAAAEAANRAHDDFLAVLSHELRTPLTATLGWLRLLRTRAPDPAGLARALQLMERNVRSEARLVEDILDVSRIVAHKVRLELRAVNVGALARAAIELLVPAAEAKAITLEAAIAPGCGVVLGDPARLQQAIGNLLSNAVKFTPEGGRVRIEGAVAGAEVRIHVIDTGPGIAPDFLPRVFERFVQAESGATRVHGGLGLGLAIARHLVELHGGTVTASSPGLGHGATFTLTLPAAPELEGSEDRGSDPPSLRDPR